MSGAPSFLHGAANRYSPISAPARGDADRRAMCPRDDESLVAWAFMLYVEP